MAPVLLFTASAETDMAAAADALVITSGALGTAAAGLTSLFVGVSAGAATGAAAGASPSV